MKIEPKFQPFYHTTNRINLPTYLFVSKEYNREAREIILDGVIEYHRDLFKALTAVETLQEASDIFEHYVKVLFSLDERVKGKKVASYIKLLRGWLFDAGSTEGAVLKGWIESRFGLVPFFHQTVISGIDTPEYETYQRSNQHRKLNSNAVYSQLDLLYTYTQTIIRRFFPQYVPHVMLYRGVNDLNDHHVVEQYDKRNVCIEQNSLTSFSLDRAVAESFGDQILETLVPYTKIFFFSEALPNRSFAGEMEFLVIGGRYDSKISYY